MNTHEYLSKLSTIVVSKNWDLPAPGREFDIGSKYHGPDRIIQEKLKEEGRKLISSTSVEDRLIGYGLEAYGHFYRSLESATEQKRKHPEKFSEYFSHWLYSDPAHLKGEFKKLSCLFPKPNAMKIKKGESFWKSRT